MRALRLLVFRSRLWLMDRARAFEQWVAPDYQTRYGTRAGQKAQWREPRSPR